MFAVSRWDDRRQPEAPELREILQLIDQDLHIPAGCLRFAHAEAGFHIHNQLTALPRLPELESSDVNEAALNERESLRRHDLPARVGVA